MRLGPGLWARCQTLQGSRANQTSVGLGGVRYCSLPIRYMYLRTSSLRSTYRYLAHLDLDTHMQWKTVHQICVHGEWEVFWLQEQNYSSFIVRICPGTTLPPCFRSSISLLTYSVACYLLCVFASFSTLSLAGSVWATANNSSFFSYVTVRCTCFWGKER